MLSVIDHAHCLPSSAFPMSTLQPNQSILSSNQSYARQFGYGSNRESNHNIPVPNSRSLHNVGNPQEGYQETTLI